MGCLPDARIPRLPLRRRHPAGRSAPRRRRCDCRMTNDTRPIRAATMQRDAARRCAPTCRGLRPSLRLQESLQSRQTRAWGPSPRKSMPAPPRSPRLRENSLPTIRLGVNPRRRQSQAAFAAGSRTTDTPWRIARPRDARRSANAVSRKCGNHSSSASRNATSSAFASAMPRFRAALTPAFRWVIKRMRESANRRTTSPPPSVEPLSMTINSKSACVCANAESIALRTCRALLYNAMTTETFTTANYPEAGSL